MRFHAAHLDGFPGRSIQGGDQVEVRCDLAGDACFDESGALLATSVAYAGMDAFDAEDAGVDEVEMEGFVTRFESPRISGRIEFTDPRTQNLMGSVKYIPDTRRPRDCWKKVRYKPRPGRMLIFPAWLYHSVAPNRSRAKGKDADRIIVSFNLSQQRRR